MTPSERARQIDKEEFEAECAAVRQRLYERLAQRRHDKRNETANWLGREVATVAFNAPNKRGRVYRPPKMHEAFGKSQSLAQWAKESGIVIGTLRTRLVAGWTLEDTLTRAVQQHRRPGVVADFPPSSGTGAGSTAQETPNITFSGIDA